MRSYHGEGTADAWSVLSMLVVSPHGAALVPGADAGESFGQMMELCLVRFLSPRVHGNGGIARLAKWECETSVCRPSFCHSV